MTRRGQTYPVARPHGLIYIMVGLAVCMAVLFASPNSKAAEPSESPAPDAPAETSEKAKDKAAPQKAEPLFHKDPNSDPATGLKAILTCQTNALGVSTAPPKQSNGQIELEIVLDAQNPETGQWHLKSIHDGHKESFAAELKKTNTCRENSCPVRRKDKKDGLQLWAPAPKSLDKLDKDEMLLIITIDETKRDLKGSMFKGPSPFVFEKGKCEKSS